VETLISPGEDEPDPDPVINPKPVA
jgi:hypothetical protein